MPGPRNRPYKPRKRKGANANANNTQAQAAVPEESTTTSEAASGTRLRPQNANDLSKIFAAAMRGDTTAIPGFPVPRKAGAAGTGTGNAKGDNKATEPSSPAPDTPAAGSSSPPDATEAEETSDARKKEEKEERKAQRKKVAKEMGLPWFMWQLPENDFQFESDSDSDVEGDKNKKDEGDNGATYRSFGGFGLQNLSRDLHAALGVDEDDSLYGHT